MRSERKSVREMTMPQTPAVNRMRSRSRWLILGKRVLRQCDSRLAAMAMVTIDAKKLTTMSGVMLKRMKRSDTCVPRRISPCCGKSERRVDAPWLRSLEWLQRGEGERE